MRKRTAKRENLLLLATFMIVATLTAVSFRYRASTGSKQIPATLKNAAHRAIPGEYLDKAIGCLTLGDVDRSFEQLSPEDWDALARSVAYTLHAYEEGSFSSYIATRENDLEFTNNSRQADVHALSSLLAPSLGSDNRAPESWTKGLSFVWKQLYPVPPIERFFIEESRGRLGFLSLAAVTVEQWEAEFEERVSELGSYINLVPAIPHRRALTEIAGTNSYPLTFADLELPFLSRDGSHGVLSIRLVLDGDSEWFLHKAAVNCRSSTSVDFQPCNLIV